MAWPWFTPPQLDRPTAAQVVQRGKSYVIASGKLIAAAICMVGLVILGRSAWLFAFIVVGVGSTWLWNAFALPQWWEWAVMTGVDFDELVAMATTAMLIDPNDQTWQNWESTRQARSRQGKNTATL